MSFITIDKLNGSSGETISTITIPEYQGLEDRTQSFKVVVDGKEVFVNVQQKAFKPSLTTNKQVVPFTQEVLAQSLQITSNFNWEARTDSSWVTLSQTEGNKGTTTIEISTSSIDSPSENRNGTINFYFGDTFVTAITVKQEFEVIFEVSTTSIDMTDETTATINVTSNVDWYCNTDITWINLDIVQGFGDKTITVTSQEFTGQDRNGRINFYVYGELKKSVNIYQTIGVVEVPTDVENCFYIEPYNVGDLIKITATVYPFVYYKNGEWVEPQLSIGYQIETRKRIYIKDFNKIDGNDIEIEGLCNVGGNIETLLGTMKERYATGLFGGTDIVDASNLILPSTTVSKYAYQGLFMDCHNLIYPPSLPATNLSEYCYERIFKNCTSLITAPSLPAMTLSKYCYQMAFEGCTSLVNAPKLNADWLEDYCYLGLFRGCTSLITAPDLPAIYLTNHCYSEMFLNCINLENAPILIAPTLTPYSYYGMFSNCHKINSITILATDISANFCLYNWVDGVSPTGTFTKKQGVNYSIGQTYLPPLGYNGIPNENWTVIEVP